MKNATDRQTSSILGLTNFEPVFEIYTPVLGSSIPYLVEFCECDCRHGIVTSKFF